MPALSPAAQGFGRRDWCGLGETILKTGHVRRRNSCGETRFGPARTKFAVRAAGRQQRLSIKASITGMLSLNSEIRRGSFESLLGGDHFLLFGGGSGPSGGAVGITVGGQSLTRRPVLEAMQRDGISVLAARREPREVGDGRVVCCVRLRLPRGGLRVRVRRR